MNKTLILLLSMMILNGCFKKEKADIIYTGGKVYTVDDSFHVFNCFAIKDGKFLAAGDEKEILAKYRSDKIIDLKGATVYPGFIDAHCHFYGYGIDQTKVQLEGTESFEEVLAMLKEYSKNNPEMKWILGRGWDQNDWKVKEYPDKTELDKLFPDVPVYLVRIDGHAALVNSKALKMAGIDENTTIKGGDIEKQSGQLTGIIFENAMEMVLKVIPAPGVTQQIKALETAQNNCFAVGLTTVSDAGLEYRVVKLMDSLHKEGKLFMRIYAMLNPTEENALNFITKGVYKTSLLNVCSVKLYVDGALGSRGACLLEPYNDKPQSGLIIYTDSFYHQYCKLAYENGFQVNMHAIGDSANRYVLNLYGTYLKGKNDRRWRIEHCQVVHENDFSLFSRYSIVPSAQSTHATSDMYWAGERLGEKRLKNAYAYKRLMETNGWIPNGSDFPVEGINPLLGFYAAVYRVDKNGFPPGGFQPENALTPEQALRSMTIWAARANFEENEKGSIEAGKLADFVILDTDICNCTPLEVLSARVLGTFISGKQVFGKGF